MRCVASHNMLNLDDQMNEELLKKAANVMHASLGEFKLKCSMT